MKELSAIAVALVSVVTYFVLATRFGLYQRWPVVHYLAAFAACVWLVRLTLRRQSWRRLYAGFALLVALALTGLFVWYTQVYSTYATDEAGVAVGEDIGDRLAGVRLTSYAGESVPVVRLGEDRATLLVFYRGHW